MTDRYIGWNGQTTKHSDKNGIAYPDFWPLTTPSLDAKLRFGDVKKSPGTSNPYRQMFVTDKLPDNPYILFQGPPGQPGVPTGQIRAYDPKNPTDTNNYIGGWLEGIGGKSQYNQANPYIPFYGGSCPGPGGTCYNTVPGYNSFNLATQSCCNSYPAIILCHDATQPDGKVFGAFQQQVLGWGNQPLAYADPNSAACQWRTDQEAFACCTAVSGTPNLKRDCAPAFMPNNEGTYSSCQSLMLEICQNNWLDVPCQNYLTSFKFNNDVPIVVQNTIRNYINSQSTRTKCGTNDYTSPAVDDNACRDDSKDEFLTKILPNICEATLEAGACDDLLDQYCASFTRDDLRKDHTLQMLCGCHMSRGQNLPNAGLILKGKQVDNQYIYPGFGVPCDPICANGKSLQRNAEPCEQTVCIMDNIVINEQNSVCDVNITQSCGDNYDNKDGKGICYMSDVDVNLINSECKSINLTQNCGSCFKYTSGNTDPADAVKFDCSDPWGNGGAHINPGPSPGGPSTKPPKSSSGWFDTNKKTIIVAAIVIIILCTIAIFAFYTFSGNDESQYEDAAVNYENNPGVYLADYQ